MCAHEDQVRWEITITLRHPTWSDTWQETLHLCDECLTRFSDMMGDRVGPILAPERPRLARRPAGAIENLEAGHINKRRAT